MKERKGTLLAFAISVLFLAMGIAQGQYTDVFTKAIRICLECVGIG